jgi:hypothetical protein
LRDGGWSIAILPEYFAISNGNDDIRLYLELRRDEAFGYSQAGLFADVAPAGLEVIRNDQ